MAETTKSGPAPSSTISTTLPEVVVGRLVGIDESGVPMVDYPGNPEGEPLSAMCTARFDESAVGRNAALLFADGDPTKPLIVGLIHSPLDEIVQVTQQRSNGAGLADLDVRSDGERVVLAADKEIVLKCGKASITLTRAGKVLLRGAYLLSRSSGVNRIKGGSVQLN